MLVLSFESIYTIINVGINSNLTFIIVYVIWLPMYVSNPHVQSWELSVYLLILRWNVVLNSDCNKHIIVILSNCIAAPDLVAYLKRTYKVLARSEEMKNLTMNWRKEEPYYELRVERTLLWTDIGQSILSFSKTRKARYF